MRTALRNLVHYTLMLVVGVCVFIICTVITPYWGVVAVLVCITIECFGWEHFHNKEGMR